MTANWQADIRAMDKWLDEMTGERYHDQPLAQHWARVAKVFEEAGEAIDALIGCTGQNPRKGEYDTWDHMLQELADVEITATLAIQHFTKDPRRTQEILEKNRQRICDRMPEEYQP